MKQITWLEQILNKEKERLSTARQVLKKNPTSYSARVALQSAELRLKDLKKRLQNEKTNGSLTGAACRNA